MHDSMDLYCWNSNIDMQILGWIPQVSTKVFTLLLFTRD
jgi:hypothetical protein